MRFPATSVPMRYHVMASPIGDLLLGGDKESLHLVQIGRASWRERV